MHAGHAWVIHGSEIPRESQRERRPGWRRTRRRMRARQGEHDKPTRLPWMEITLSDIRAGLVCSEEHFIDATFLRHIRVDFLPAGADASGRGPAHRDERPPVVVVVLARSDRRDRTVDSEPRQ